MVGRAPLVWRGNNGGRRGPAMDTRDETRCREVRLFILHFLFLYSHMSKIRRYYSCQFWAEGFRTHAGRLERNVGQI